MKKKIMLLILAIAALVLILVGCGEKNYEVSKKSYDNVMEANVNGTFIASDEGKLYLFKMNGKKVFKTGYDELSFLENGYLLARNASDVGYTLLDWSGNVLLSSSVETIITGATVNSVDETTYLSDGTTGYFGSYFTYVTVNAVNAQGDALVAYYGVNTALMQNFTEVDKIEIIDAVTEKTYVDGSNLVANEVYQGSAILVYGDSTTSVKIFDGNKNCYYEKSLTDASVTAFYGRFFIQDAVANTVSLVKKDGSLLDVTDAKDFIGEEKAYYYTVDASGVNVINLEDDSSVTLAGVEANVKGEYLVVTSSDGKYVYYDDTLTQKAVISENLSAVYNSAYGIYYYTDNASKIYDAELRPYVEGNNIVKAYGKTDGKIYAVIETDTDYYVYFDGVQKKVYSKSTYDYEDSLKGGIFVFVDSETSKNIYFSVVKGEELYNEKDSVSFSNIDSFPVSYGIDGTDFVIMSEGTVFTYEFNANEISTLLSYTKVGESYAYFKFTVTETYYLDSFVEGEPYFGETRTETSYLVFLYSPGSGLTEIYRGYNSVIVSHDTNYLTVSTESSFFKSYDSAVMSKLSDRTDVYALRYSYVDNEKVVSYEKLYSHAFSDVTKITEEYMWARKPYSDKQAIYAVNGKMLVDAKYYIEDISGDRAIVSLSDVPGSYGVIQLTSKGYKVKEDLNKYSIKFIGDFYCYSEIKNGIEVYTYKTLDGDKVINKVIATANVGKVCGAFSVNDGKAYVFILLDNGKDGWKVLFVKTSI